MPDRKPAQGINMLPYLNRRDFLKLPVFAAALAACAKPEPAKCVEERTPLEGIESAAEVIYPCGKSRPDTASISFRINAGILDTPEGFQQYSEPDKKFVFRMTLAYQKEQGLFNLIAALGELPSREFRDGFQILMSRKPFEDGKDTYLHFSWDRWILRNPVVNTTQIEAGQLSTLGLKVNFPVPTDRAQYAPSTLLSDRLQR